MSEIPQTTVGVDPAMPPSAKQDLKRYWKKYGEAIGILIAFAFLTPDIFKGEVTPWAVAGAVGGILIFLVGVSNKVEETREDVITQHGKVVASLQLVQESVDENTSRLRKHEDLLVTRTMDRVRLIGFDNLLAYLPFYLAEDLGYLRDEHIEISSFSPSLDDESTAQALSDDPLNSIAICDPYMCLGRPTLKMIYPLCSGVAAWPMTLNWIGATLTSPASKGSPKVRVAAYQAPSTTNVLANLVAQRIIKPRLARDSDIQAVAVEFTPGEARFAESDNREETSKRLKSLLGAYEVLMLWEPHCEMAMQLGARYLFPSDYEKVLKDFGSSLIYSAVVASEELLRDNPTLPTRLRRAVDRAVSRLQDPDHLAYCRATLDSRRLLVGCDDALRSAVLKKLVKNVPLPCDTEERGTTGWNGASYTWAEGLRAADNLRHSLLRNDPNLALNLGTSGHGYATVENFRKVISGV